MKLTLLPCLAALLSAFSSHLHAVPLQRTDVPAGALWVAHMDLDRLRPTVVGQYVLAEMQKPEAQKKLAGFQAIFNFDLATQLHGLTLYSAGPKPEDGILLVYADVDPARLETLAGMAQDHQAVAHNQQVIHHWIDEKKPARDGVKPRTYAAVVGRNLVVFGQKQATVAQALDAINRFAPSLPANVFAELGSTTSGNFIEAATLQMGTPGSEPNAALFRLATEGRFVVGEVARQTTASLTLATKTEEIGAAMSAVAEGLIALIKLKQDSAEAVRLANSLRVTHKGTLVRVDLAMSADDVVAVMKADAARKAAAKAHAP